MAYIETTTKLSTLADYQGQVVFTPTPSNTVRSLDSTLLVHHPITVQCTDGAFPANTQLAEGTYTVTIAGSISFTITVPSGTGTYDIVDLLYSDISGSITEWKGTYGIKFFASATALRAESSAAVGFSYVANVGLFRWDATSTATDDGETVIKLTAVSTGRYLHVERDPS